MNINGKGIHVKSVVEMEFASINDTDQHAKNVREGKSATNIAEEHRVRGNLRDKRS